MRKFFSYPVSLSLKTLTNLGFKRVVKICYSYICAVLSPIQPEKNMEDFFINRFGKELYETFFKDYTKKVWGIPCKDIAPDWGSQRIKGLSVFDAISAAVKRMFVQKDVLKELDEFYYPKLGPGQLWERVADQVKQNGGDIQLDCKVTQVEWAKDKVNAVWVEDKSGNENRIPCDYLVSTMPLKHLINFLGCQVPEEVQTIVEGLVCRDFISVELVVKKMKIKNGTDIHTENDMVPDNWIYIQERDVQMGRLQVLNNWSPYLPQNSDTVLIGVEYFCSQGDDLWAKSDEELEQLAINELVQIEILDVASDVLDGMVYRAPNAYPAYFGTYRQLGVVKDFLNGVINLYPVGRAGVHQYLNIDHAMLMAMQAAKCIQKQEKLLKQDNCDDLDGSYQMSEQIRLETKKNKSKIWDLEMAGEYS